MLFLCGFYVQIAFRVKISIAIPLFYKILGASRHILYLRRFIRLMPETALTPRGAVSGILPKAKHRPENFPACAIYITY